MKEAMVGGHRAARRRLVIVRHPAEAKRDRQKREDSVQEVNRKLQSLQQLSGEPHRKAACTLRSHPTYGRSIRQTSTGILKLDQKKIRTVARYDGKVLLSTSDDRLPVEGIVAGYQQLAGVKRVFRDLKHLIDIRPVYHHLSDRITAHVHMSRLVMLLTFCSIQVGFF